MGKFNLNGKDIELPDEVIAQLNSKSKGGGGSAPGLDAIKAKHPWIGEATELLQIASGTGFKYGVEVSCQAGKLVRTTSRFTGVDSVTPVRVDHKTSAMRTYDYTGLPACGSKIRKATSDLHQSHLCDGCKAKLTGVKKKNLLALAKQISSQAASAKVEAPAPATNPEPVTPPPAAEGEVGEGA